MVSLNWTNICNNNIYMIGLHITCTYIYALTLEYLDVRCPRCNNMILSSSFQDLNVELDIPPDRDRGGSPTGEAIYSYKGMRDTIIFVIWDWVNWNRVTLRENLNTWTFEHIKIWPWSFHYLNLNVWNMTGTQGLHGLDPHNRFEFLQYTPGTSVSSAIVSHHRAFGTEW